jgi:indolepyruvate ferredoxin oxidoreductase alpha subunit
MKHVGLNVAADPFMTMSYLGVRGGLVIAMGDDPGAYSSQNEQDSRFYAYFAKIPCLEPYDGETAKNYTKLAFELSETFHLPVILRTQT